MAFQIAARTVLELGSELISSDIIAFYELVKNGFDAKTRDGVSIAIEMVLRRNAYLRLKQKIERGLRVEPAEILGALDPEAPLELRESANAIAATASAPRQEAAASAVEQIYLLNRIIVSDTGIGMSASDLAGSFLVIGTPSRKRDVEKALANGVAQVPYLGEKGIGRLSAMRLGDSLRVETRQAEDRHLNVLQIDWSRFADIDAMIGDIPTDIKQEPLPEGAEKSGTRIIIGSLTEDWTKARFMQMASYEFARLTDPFRDQKRRPRIALFWNGQRIDIPWMDKTLIELAHASVTGSYVMSDEGPELRCKMEVNNLGFAHPRESETATVKGTDLISALIGESESRPEQALVSVGPFSFEIYWFNRRILTGIVGIGDQKVVRDLQERWSGILLFRDGFRVLPYGDDEDDWLGLDRKAMRRSGYTLNKTQFVGRVEISRSANPFLVDQTNREGLRETSEQQVLVEALQYVIQDQLFRFMKVVGSRYKDQKIDLTSAKTEIDSLSARAKAAVAALRRRLSGPEVADVQQVLLEFSDFVERARQRIAEVEAEGRQMIHMAGVGLMVEVIAHELARASENALQNIEALQKRDVPDDVKTKLAALRSQMKSLSKRIRILDPLSVSGRQTAEIFTIEQVVDEVLDGHQAQFERHRIVVDFRKPEVAARVRLVRGMLVQIIENLLSNSKYWLAIKAGHESFQKRITIALVGSPLSLIYEDNGPGVAVENRERIFRPFFSLKEKSKRRGLGLFIARECAEQMGGTFELSDAQSPDGRLRRFVLEVPAEVEVR